jgi:SAM-dependent methyltransferase
VLFPRGAISLVESVYRDNPVADHFNTVLGDRLLSFIDATAPGTRLRILEIGAGTGGTSAELFKRLADRADRIEEYAYTDLSQLFLMHAKERFGTDIPYIKRRIFNVEKALAPQRYAPGTYDIVIAANVLHATTRIRESLRNAKALLKQGGVLLINELATHKLSMHVSFGLLEGWWLNEDLGMRTPGCPVLDASQWAHVLAAEGFEHVGIATGEPELLGQQVIEAYSDGWVRQDDAPRLGA